MYALGTRSPLPQGRPDGSTEEVSVSFEETLTADQSAAEAYEQALLSALDDGSTGIDSPSGPPPKVAAEEGDMAPPDAEDVTLPDDPSALAKADAEQAPAPWQAQLPSNELRILEMADPGELDAMLTAAADSLLEDIELPELADLEPLPDLEPETLPLEEAQRASSSDSASPPHQDSAPSMATASATMRPQAQPSNLTSPQNLTSQPLLNSAQTTRPPQTANAALPEAYRLRQSPSKLQIASAFGADENTEAAVTSALQWLASAQDTTGAWVAGAHGAGTETYALGQSRYGTGAKADTGISGLALLAFLSAGHTHLDGDHKQTVASGLRYLIDSQMPSGDLSGRKQIGDSPSVLNARMYCHGIATLALAEAYTMTKDEVLREPVLRAAQYTINAQDLRSGGWRYKPRIGGDLSQFGWQAMALKSVQRAGVKIPTPVQDRMAQFLKSCEAGRNKGLATYLPGDGRPSVTMTAEALACNLLLERTIRPEQQGEAVAALTNNLPGQEQDNVYYWYYATLAMFQLQDDNWKAWNAALKQRLLATQATAGPLSGSWEPDRVWGGYGGRVYSTAMSCLCLEVYYRFLPMYNQNRYENRGTRNYATTPRQTIR
jgi:hypothetical protein